MNSKSRERAPRLSYGGSQQAAIELRRATTRRRLFFSLAFLYQTPEKILDAIVKNSKDDTKFVYGMSDKKVPGLDTGGLDLKKPDQANPAAVSPSALKGNVPEPFKSEPDGGGGIRLHQKFVVIDFDKPTGRRLPRFVQLLRRRRHAERLRTS